MQCITTIGLDQGTKCSKTLLTSLDNTPYLFCMNFLGFFGLLVGIPTEFGDSVEGKGGGERGRGTEVLLQIYPFPVFLKGYVRYVIDEKKRLQQK